ncbi:MAG: hypothetical protein ACOCXG_00775 [Nanoarchaeota archaeon]
MESVTISKDDLYSLIRKAVREELNEYNEISASEQEELENLHGKRLFEEDYSKENCVRL